MHAFNLREQLCLDTLSTDQVIQRRSPFKALVPQFGDKTILAVGRGDQDFLKYIAFLHGFKRVVVLSDIKPGVKMQISTILVFNNSHSKGCKRFTQRAIHCFLSQKGQLATKSPLNSNNYLPNNGYLRDG
ncbi:hypothetical protein BDZ45DRAFT_739790 [Acephala macrosclerotiorum]|nr:hypothetical protein BDZ45DRAFT_739790 [Acephala macrosclerotiorum]